MEGRKCVSCHAHTHTPQFLFSPKGFLLQLPALNWGWGADQPSSWSISRNGTIQGETVCLSWVLEPKDLAVAFRERVLKWGGGRDLLWSLPPFPHNPLSWLFLPR